MMKFFHRKQLVLLVVTPYLIALTFLLLFPNLKTGITVDDNIGVTEGLTSVGDFEFNNDSIILYVQFTDFDPNRGTAEMKILPWPSGNATTGLSSSAFFDRDLQFIVDRLDVKGPSEFKANTQIGAIPYLADVLSLRNGERANDFFYPFDKYELDNYVFVSERIQNEWVPIPAMEEFYIWSPLPGFDVNFERTILDWDRQPKEQINEKVAASEIIQERKEGSVSYFAQISRSKASFIITLLITIFCLTCSAALVAITREIVLRRRPPSTQVLVWASATALGEIQLRNLLPGNPRIGIAFDLLIVFPSLIMSICVVAITSWFWMKREDYVN
jgi:hypothetical protein